jgi:hypothetical protein
MWVELSAEAGRNRGSESLRAVVTRQPAEAETSVRPIAVTSIRLTLESSERGRDDALRTRGGSTTLMLSALKSIPPFRLTERVQSWASESQSRPANGHTIVAESGLRAFVLENLEGRPEPTVSNRHTTC